MLRNVLFQLQLNFVVSHEYTHHIHGHLAASPQRLNGVWTEFDPDTESGGIDSQVQELDADGYAIYLGLAGRPVDSQSWASSPARLFGRRRPRVVPSRLWVSAGQPIRQARVDDQKSNGRVPDQPGAIKGSQFQIRLFSDKQSRGEQLSLPQQRRPVQDQVQRFHFRRAGVRSSADQEALAVIGDGVQMDRAAAYRLEAFVLPTDPPQVYMRVLSISTHGEVVDTHVIKMGPARPLTRSARWSRYFPRTNSSK